MYHCLTVAEAPVAPTTFSQALHPKTSLGHDKFVEVVKKYSNDMLVSQSILEKKIIQDPQIKGILLEKASVLDRQLLGLSLE